MTNQELDAIEKQARAALAAVEALRSQRTGGATMEDIHPKMTDSDKKRVAGAIVRALRDGQA
jgi:hypothetical protein